MKARITLISRLLLGLIFFIFGLNGFFHFIPLPPHGNEAAVAFMGGLFQAGYFFPLLALIQVISGFLLLSGFYVPLTLLFLAPITVNILLFHLFLDPSGIVMAVLVIALNIFLGWAYINSFLGILQKRNLIISSLKD